MKSLLINNLIKILQNVKEEHGNLEVFLSADPEGNSFNSFEETGEGFYNIIGNKIVIYPWEDHIDPSQIEEA